MKIEYSQELVLALIEASETGNKDLRKSDIRSVLLKFAVKELKDLKIMDKS